MWGGTCERDRRPVPPLPSGDGTGRQSQRLQFVLRRAILC
eukprot:SAG11_NODE_23132_length_394_cov_1.410169_1_plen_39_part_10